MRKIVGIIIMGLFLIGNCTVFAECPTESDFDNPQEYRTYIYSDKWKACLDDIENAQKENGNPLNKLSWAKAELQSKFNNCANKIDESLLTGTCDSERISSAFVEAYSCFFSISADKSKEYKNKRDTCIDSFKDGEDWLKALETKYDNVERQIKMAISWYNLTDQDSWKAFRDAILKLNSELTWYQKQINEKKQQIEQCKTIYKETIDLQNQIQNTLWDIQKQENTLGKARNKYKQDSENLLHKTNKQLNKSKNVEKALQKEQDKLDNMNYTLNQACLSARDFLYTLKYGTTMKKGNPWNDLIENRSPREMLDKVVYDANAIDQYQETAMDGVTSRDESCVNGWGRITNTLCWVKNHIHPYIQWIVYLGLTLSVILLIYNGFKMVTNVMHGEGDFWKIKTNILYIGLWIIILTGFYYLLDIVMAIINFLFD